MKQVDYTKNQALQYAVTLYSGDKFEHKYVLEAAQAFYDFIKSDDDAMPLSQYVVDPCFYTNG